MSEPMKNPEVRWRQRYQNYRQALSRLSDAVALSRQRPLSELEQQGLIQAFEFTHELAWNVLKDYLEEQGVAGVIGSRNASREAFKNGLIPDGQTWMDMIHDRNLSSHTHHTEVAAQIVQRVLTRFHPALVAMERRFVELEAKEAGGL
jgi:nucleotidyltransferase substrate binding protein (TIGR01987 family)